MITHRDNESTALINCAQLFQRCIDYKADKLDKLSDLLHSTDCMLIDTLKSRIEAKVYSEKKLCTLRMCERVWNVQRDLAALMLWKTIAENLGG